MSKYFIAFKIDDALKFLENRNKGLCTYVQKYFYVIKAFHKI